MEHNEETTDETAAELVPAPQLRYRIAFFVTALVVLGLIVTLPFSVKTVVDDVLGPATGRVIQLISQSGPAGAEPRQPPSGDNLDRRGTTLRDYSPVGTPCLCRLCLEPPSAPCGHHQR